MARKHKKPKESEEAVPEETDGSEDQGSQAVILKADQWLERYPRATEQKTRWFWIGVVGFSALIGIMWLITMKIQMGALAERKTTDSELFSKTKEEWDKIFEERDKKISEQGIKSALSQALAVLTKTPEAATPTSSTTTLMTATSTIATTTQP